MAPGQPAAHATPEQRERYLIPGARGDRRDAVAISEAGAGSDFSAATTTATPDGNGGYVVNGEKWFVTVGDVADFLIVLAYVQPGHAPTIFLVDVDTPGVKITNVPRYTHTFVYEHPEFIFENVHVGPEAVLGEVGAGLELTRDWFTEERLMIGARTIGAAERALTLAVDWARERVQGGEPLINRQLIQGMIADSVVDITTNRAYTHQVAWEFDQADAGDADQRKTLHAKAAVVKLAASEASNRVVDRAVQIFGGRGYIRDYPVERLWRELRVDRIWEGTSEIQRLVIANETNKRGLEKLLSFRRGVASPDLAAGTVEVRREMTTRDISAATHRVRRRQAGSGRCTRCSPVCRSQPSPRSPAIAWVAGWNSPSPPTSGSPIPQRFSGFLRSTSAFCRPREG